MDNIQVYFGNCLQQELVWIPSRNLYNCVTYYESAFFNIFPISGMLNIVDIERTLHYKTGDLDDKDILEFINETHVYSISDKTWIKLSSDSTEFKDIEKTPERWNDDYKGMIIEYHKRALKLLSETIE